MDILKTPTNYKSIDYSVLFGIKYYFLLATAIYLTTYLYIIFNDNRI